MFKPGNIVYGYVSGLGFRKAKHKYLITLYHDEAHDIVACFTTSQHYYGVPEEDVRHGAIRRNGVIYSYVFEKGVEIGSDPDTGAGFAFPDRTTVTFDYGVKQGFVSAFSEGIEDPKVVCVLNNDEFGNLLYAMYKSPQLKQNLKPYIEETLRKLSENPD